MTEFVVVRHGSTAMNEEDIVIGHLDPELSPHGKRQARRLGKALAKERFDAIVTSDLRRARETAAMIASCNAQAPPVMTAPELREIDYGRHAGRKKESLKSEEPRYHADPDYLHPEGESFHQLQERVKAFVRRLGRKHRRVLVVTHAGAMRALYAAHMREPFAEHLNMNIPHTAILRITEGRKPVLGIV